MPGMSKQDYELIAERIFTAPVPEPTPNSGEPHVRLELAQHFADELARTNSRFDRAKFVSACMTGAHIRRSILPRP